jgi:hypothetical protein
MTPRILYPVQMLDQQIRTARRITKQFPHLGQRLIVELPAFGVVPPLALAGLPYTCRMALVVRIECHVLVSAFAVLLPSRSGCAALSRKQQPAFGYDKEFDRIR